MNCVDAFRCFSRKLNRAQHQIDNFEERYEKREWDKVRSFFGGA
jgi:hypothetical protein